MMPRDEELTNLWQRYRDQYGPRLANEALVHDFYQSPTDRATDEAVRLAISEPEFQSCCVPKSGTTTWQLQSRLLEAF